jgi:glucoside 3-dehydrogenase (cytochrome c) hitch-hiker subunit
MERRDLLRALGAAGALALLPNEMMDAWARVASGVAPRDGLTAAQLALVGAIADVILPRSDSPSATDVGVPAFIDVIVSENYTENARAAFVAGLDAFDAKVASRTGSAFAALNPDAQAAAISTIEGATDRRAEPARSYWQLKGLIIHGYFTSEAVMKRVLHTVITPGRFNGAAPMPHA